MRTFAAFMLLSLLSCKDKIISPLPTPVNQDDVITMNSISNYDSISNQVKTKGDTLAYNKLFYFLMDSNKEDRTDTLMYYSKIMADKFTYERAYFDYFKALCEKNNIEADVGNYSSIDISSMDKPSKEKAEKWLKKMLEKNIISKEQFDLIKKGL